jgi:hypothetical protein
MLHPCPHGYGLFPVGLFFVFVVLGIEARVSCMLVHILPLSYMPIPIRLSFKS